MLSSNYKEVLKDRPELKAKDAGRQLRILCPWHKDSDPSLYIDFGKEEWYCFGCQKGGKLPSLLRKLGILKGGRERGVYVEVGKTKKIKVEKPSQEIREYFIQERGFDLDSYKNLIDDFKIKQTWLGEAALYFPVWDFENRFVGNLRRRLSDKQYYLSSGFKSERYLYGEWLLKDCKSVVLVEGVFDLFKVHLAGFPCVAVFGLSGDSLKLARLRTQGIVESLLFFDSDVSDKVYNDWSYYGKNFDMNIKQVRIDKGDPGEMDVSEIKELLKEYKTFV